MADEVVVAPLSVGKVMTLGHVDWSECPKHVVLLVWSSCAACEAQADFYRTLSRMIRANGTRRLIVVAIEPLPSALAWLKEKRIEPDMTLRVDTPSSIGLLLVPSLVTVDSQGIVTDLWATSLDVETQSAFLDRVDGPPSQLGRPLTNVTPVKEVAHSELRAPGEQLTLLDARPRRDITQRRSGVLCTASGASRGRCRGSSG